VADQMQRLRSLPVVEFFPSLNHAETVRFYSSNLPISRRCVAPLHGVVVKPNGDVRFCPDEWIDDYTLGNIRHEDLKTIWNNGRPEDSGRSCS
jgi:MoaA/NifB/PqqE/SkfB family radical SAM enzyme